MGLSVVMLFMVLISMIVLARTVKVVKENQRLAVFRLGKLESIRGPGLQILMPFIDSANSIDLNEEVPGWMSLSGAELEKRVREFVLSRPVR